MNKDVNPNLINPSNLYAAPRSPIKEPFYMSPNSNQTKNLENNYATAGEIGSIYMSPKTPVFCKERKGLSLVGKSMVDMSELAKPQNKEQKKTNDFVDYMSPKSPLMCKKRGDLSYASAAEVIRLTKMKTKEQDKTNNSAGVNRRKDEKKFQIALPAPLQFQIKAHKKENFRHGKRHETLAAVSNVEDNEEEEEEEEEELYIQAENANLSPNYRPPRFNANRPIGSNPPSELSKVLASRNQDKAGGEAQKKDDFNLAEVERQNPSEHETMAPPDDHTQESDDDSDDYINYNSAYLDFGEESVRDIGQKIVSYPPRASDDQLPEHMGGKISKIKKNKDGSGQIQILVSKAEPNRNAVHPRPKKTSSNALYESNARPISMPPCDPPLPPSPNYYSAVSPTPSLLGQRPLPPPPNEDETSVQEPSNYENLPQAKHFDQTLFAPTDSGSISALSRNRQSSIPKDAPPAPPCCDPTGSHYETAISFAKPSYQRENSLSPVLSPPAATKTDLLMTESRFSNSKQTPDSLKKVHPIAVMLRAKKTEAQLKKLPLKLSFQTQNDEESDCASSSSANSVTIDDKNSKTPRHKVGSSSTAHRSTEATSSATSKNIRSSFKKLKTPNSQNNFRQPQVKPPVVPKKPTPTANIQSAISENTSSSANTAILPKSLKHVIPPNNQQGLSTKPSKPRPPIPSPKSPQSPPSVDTNDSMTSLPRLHVTPKVDRSTKPNCAGFKQNSDGGFLNPSHNRRVDDRGYTMHKLLAQRLENQKKILSEVVLQSSLVPADTLPEPSGENAPQVSIAPLPSPPYCFSQTQAGQADLSAPDLPRKPASGDKMSSRQDNPKLHRNSENIVPKSPNKSILKPNMPPPPRPTQTPPMNTGAKRPPVRPPPPSKDKIEKAKQRRQLNSIPRITKGLSPAEGQRSHNKTFNFNHNQDRQFGSGPRSSSVESNDDESLYYVAIDDFNQEKNNADVDGKRLDDVTAKKKEKGKNFASSVLMMKQKLNQIGQLRKEKSPFKSSAFDRELARKKNLYDDDGYEDDEGEGIYAGIDDQPGDNVYLQSIATSAIRN